MTFEKRRVRDGNDIYYVKRDGTILNEVTWTWPGGGGSTVTDSYHMGSDWTIAMKAVLLHDGYVVRVRALDDFEETMFYRIEDQGEK